MKSCEGFVLIMGLLAAAGCASQDGTAAPEDGTATTQQSVTLDDRIAQCSADPRVTIGIVHVDGPVPESVLEKIRKVPAVVEARAVVL